MSQKHQVGVNGSFSAIISKMSQRMQLLNIPKLKLGNRLQKGLRELYNDAWYQKCSTIFYWYVKYGAFEASLDETRYQGCMRRLEVVNSHWLLSMSISASNVWNGNARDRCLILIHCTYRHVCVTLKSLSYNRDHPRYNVSSKQQTAGDAAICPLDLHQRLGHDAQGWGASILGHAPRCSQQGKHDMPRYLKGGFPILELIVPQARHAGSSGKCFPRPLWPDGASLHRFLLPFRMCLSPFCERRLETLPPSMKSIFTMDHSVGIGSNIQTYYPFTLL